MPTYTYKRILPVDLLEVANDQGGGTTLSEAIAAIQADRNRTFACPNCKVGDQSTGYVEILDPPIKVICPVCAGYLKTQVKYIPNPKNIYQFIPFTPIYGPATVVATETIQLGDAVPTGTWSSGNTERATVDPVTGIVTGVSAGAVIITYTVSANCEEYTVTKEITVTTPS